MCVSCVRTRARTGAGADLAALGNMPDLCYVNASANKLTKLLDFTAPRNLRVRVVRDLLPWRLPDRALPWACVYAPPVKREA